MTIRKSGKIVRLVDQALETAKRTQIKLMEAQIETPREDSELAQHLIAAVEDTTDMVKRLTTISDAVTGMRDELVSIANAEKD